MEASGTGNMKLALNGALTIGTLDGANIEIREQVGADNIVIFGMTADEVAAKRLAGYAPSEIARANPELKRTLDMIDSGFFSPGNLADGKPIVDRLLSDGEPYFVLADFDAYSKAQDAVDALYLRPDDWARTSANALYGIFSSDHARVRRADRHIKPVL
jgi:starch phosphorylase